MPLLWQHAVRVSGSSVTLEELPSSIRTNLMLSPQNFLASFHTRPLKLFAPTTEGPGGGVVLQQSLSSGYLPPQVVVTLAWRL
jgi:hypothetical protein